MAASIAPECNEIKEYAHRLSDSTRPQPLTWHGYRKYDTCFLKWYSEKYLRGNTTSNDCEALFTKYKSCLNKILKEKGIDSMLDDARKSSSETDAEFLRKS
ncbi:hypothetical protein NUU61_004914 [Penicillium alfredii]|uniref:Mitochondrial distribution and morphology protein 35 n=1 Tax=Penicillium alfredii TaxID=1506179 RepID=A0A9W9F8J1_9EURO|nr:uncharacterized protein NUU61_004914 [Penicillium alfredii]KAJ5095558.1 hypothetical protein NUU61_004914 [Penicillium alfredii]